MNSSEPMSEAFSTLEPSAETVERIAPAVMTAWQARPRALWREWLDLLRAAPLRHGTWAAAACAVLLLTPVGSALSAVLSLARPGAGAAQAQAIQPHQGSPEWAHRMLDVFRGGTTAHAWPMTAR